MQKSSDLDVRRLAARMGAALPAYRSFRNSPAWGPAAPAADDLPAPVPASAREPVERPPAATPATPGEADIAALRMLMAAPTPAAPRPVGSAPPAGGFPLIDAALAARPALPTADGSALPTADGSTLAVLRGRLAGLPQSRER